MSLLTLKKNEQIKIKKLLEVNKSKWNLRLLVIPKIKPLTDLDELTRFAVTLIFSKRLIYSRKPM